MKSRTAEETMCLLTGAALGAAALYFLDPNAGSRRRHRVTAAAEDALGHALGTAKSGAHAIASGARNVSGRLVGYAGEHSHDLADQGQQWLGRARQIVDRARHSAQDAVDTASSDASHRADDWRHWAARGVSRASHKTQAWLGHEEHEGFGVGTVLSSTVGCCAVGMGIMYFADPERGSSRRSQVIRTTSNIVFETGRRMRGIGQDIARQFGGLFGKSGQGGGYSSRQRLDSDRLIRDIRSQLNNFSQGANRVQFMADADGTVTVTGDIGSNEVDRLLDYVHNVPGVSHVINRMTVQNAAARETHSPVPQ